MTYTERLESVTTLKGLYELREELLTTDADRRKDIDDCINRNFYVQRIETMITLAERNGKFLCQISELTNQEG